MTSDVLIQGTFRSEDEDTAAKWLRVIQVACVILREKEWAP